MNVISSSPEVKALASKGLATAAAQPTQQAQYTTNDQYLASIASQGAATPGEKLMAATLRQCTSTSLKYPTALHAQSTALKALSAGVGGPVGQALARIGLEVSRGGFNQEDQYIVDAPWLRAIAREGQPLEQQVANAALTVTGQSLRYPTAVAAQHQALSMVANGVTGTAQKVVADYGQALLRSAYNQEDQHKVALQLLPVLKSAAGTPAGTAIATVASNLVKNSMKYSTVVAAEMHALQMIAAPPSADADVARATYGVNAMQTAYNQEDQYLVGNVTLDALAKGASPQVASVAQAAKAALATGMKYHSAVGFQSAVLNRVAGGVPSFERALADVGQKLKSLAYNEEDQYNLGRALMNHLESASADPKVQALARYGKQVCAVPGVTYAQGLQAQNAVFDGIVTGNMKVPAMITAGGTSHAAISLPVLDPDAAPSDQKAAVEASIAANKASIRKLEDEQAKVASDVADAQQQLQDIQDATKALADKEAPLLKRFTTLGKVVKGAGIAAAGGMVVAAAIGTPIAVAVGLVGVFAFIGTQTLRSRTEKQILEMRREAERSTWEVLHAQARIQSGATRSAELRKAQAQVEKAISEAQGKLDTLRMATAPTVQPDTTVRMEAEFVMVGGLKIPRNTNATPSQDTPA